MASVELAQTPDLGGVEAPVATQTCLEKKIGYNLTT